MTSLGCPACDRSNGAHRGYCGGCGAVLQPVCRGCRFVNDAGDRYCGGCGNQLVTPGVAPGITATAVRVAPAVTDASDELAELFVVSTQAAAELPQNITQGDLDRLFSGGS